MRITHLSAKEARCEEEKQSAESEAEEVRSIGHCRIALEMGPHSPWVSRLIAEFADEVIVANPRQLKLITESSRNCVLWTHKPWRASRE
jgi:hypothetical protein